MKILTEKTPTNEVTESFQLANLLEELELLLRTDFDAALERSKEVIHLAEQSKDRFPLAKAYMLGSIANMRTADYLTAEKWGKEAINIAKDIGEREIEARCLNVLGFIHYYERGDYVNAISYQLEHLKLVQELNDKDGQMRALNNIGVLHEEIGEREKAFDCDTKALALAIDQRNIEAECAASSRLAVYYRDHGDYDKAIELLLETLPKAEATSEMTGVSGILITLAQAYLNLGAYDKALEINKRSLTVNQKLGSNVNQCETFITQGRLELIQGNLDQAIHDLKQAYQFAKTTGFKRHIYESHYHLSECYEQKGNYKEALDHARAYYQLEKEVRSEDIERKTRFLSSQAEAEKFKHEAEIERLKNVELVSVNRELEQTKEALTYQAEHDHLTGLANRALFEQSLQQTIKDSELKSGQFAVLYLDLDGFKKINDTLGHDVGDQLLIEVATRLKNSVRMNDLVARMGGDEFTVLLNHIRELENVELLANIILASLKRPFELSLAPQPIAISASIGIAMYPRDGQDATELKKRADIAMYNVKYSGKNGLQMYAAN